MAKKILDFKTDEAKSDDYVLVTNDHDGTRKVRVPNLNFKCLKFSGTTDENGYVQTDLNVFGNHPISVYVENALSFYYPEPGKQIFTVRVCGFNNEPIVGTSISGKIYYVTD